MRWDELFDDLESQLEQELDTERTDVLAEEERLRLGRLTFRDRLVELCRPGAERREVSLQLRDGSSLGLRPDAAGRDWVAGTVADAGRVRSRCVVPIAAIASVVPRGPQLAATLGIGEPVDADAPGAGLAGRLGVAFVLRDLARRRATVELRTSWTVLHGTVDRIGRDHLDLAEHDPGLPRRATAVRQTRLVPFVEILLVRF